MAIEVCWHRATAQVTRLVLLTLLKSCDQSSGFATLFIGMKHELLMAVAAATTAMTGFVML
jgi:hypothetical protein